MAKRKHGCFSCHWLAKVWAACLASTLMVALCSGNVLRAADLVRSNSPLASGATVQLEYHETDYTIVNLSLSITPRSMAFRKEPALAFGRVIRGFLNFGGSSSNDIPFLWQPDAGKLFLDVNRNRDLTDDPDGVYTTRAAGPASYQTFTNVHLPFNTPAGKRPVLANLNLYGSSSPLRCIAAVRSFWEGRLTLQGRDWQAGLISSNLNPLAPFEESRLLLRPWSERDQPFSAYGGLLDAVPFSRNLFLNGYAYQVTCAAAAQNGQTAAALQFTAQSVATGELKINGNSIRRLMLAGGPYLVVLDQPEGTVQIPTGSYGQFSVQLGQGGAAFYYNSDLRLPGRQISVDGLTPASLTVGGPLTNSVAITRQPQDLVLNYRLIGAGGETYRLANRDSAHPPEFAIYQGDRQIASGKFEFG